MAKPKRSKVPDGDSPDKIGWHVPGTADDAIPNCPEGEDLNEYIGAKTVEFYNDLAMLFESVIVDAREKYKRPGYGFPPEFIYYWTEDVEAGTEVAALTAPDYMEKALVWIDKVLDDRTIFPIDQSVDFPGDFISNHICKIFTFMFRVFAILYHGHYELLVQNKVANLLNTALKHFIFFSIRFNLLVEPEELEALKTPLIKLQHDYIKAWNAQPRKTVTAKKKSKT